MLLKEINDKKFVLKYFIFGLSKFIFILINSTKALYKKYKRTF